MNFSSGLYNFSSSMLFEFFSFFTSLRVHVKCSPEWHNQHIYKDSSMFPMNRGKRQSAHKAHANNLILGPRRRRRDLEPHDGEANVDADAVAAAGALDDLDEDDSYEAPIVPSKAQVPEKENEDNIMAENKMEQQNIVAESFQPKQDDEIKPQPKVEQKEAFKSPNILPTTVQEYSVQENPFCMNFVLPLTKTVVKGVNNYNMSVSCRFDCSLKINIHK